MAEGEDAKDLGTVEDLCRDWAQWGLTRGDCVVAVGGGVVTDTAGFAAAVYHRGVAVVHVPTTLLGQVDAAIGGKTGVNLPEGKNLVGAFWQPAAVLCDTEVLATLPPREYRSGHGEMAKYPFLGVDDLRRPARSRRRSRPACAARPRWSASDEREGGRRAILNYGHTLAHALETAGELRPAPRRGGRHRPDLRRRARPPPRPHRRRPGRRAPPGRRRLRPADDLPAGLDPDELVDLFARDKKAVDGLTFVLDGPDGVEPVAVDDRSCCSLPSSDLRGPRRRRAPSWARWADDATDRAAPLRART